MWSSTRDFRPSKGEDGKHPAQLEGNRKKKVARLATARNWGQKELLILLLPRALLMAIRAQLLAAFMLIDLCFPAFL